jgi:hypothetical protein
MTGEGMARAKAKRRGKQAPIETPRKRGGQSVYKPEIADQAHELCLLGGETLG